MLPRRSNGVTLSHLESTLQADTVVQGGLAESNRAACKTPNTFTGIRQVTRATRGLKINPTLCTHHAAAAAAAAHGMS